MNLIPTPPLIRMVVSLGLFSAYASHAAVLFSGDGGAGPSVTPGSPSSSATSSAFPVPPSDGSLPGSTSGSAVFTADGITAVGSADGTYLVQSGWNGLRAGTTASADYPGTLPNSESGNALGYGASGYGYARPRAQYTGIVFTGPAPTVLVSLNLLFQESHSVTVSESATYDHGNTYAGAYVSARFDSYPTFDGSLTYYADGSALGVGMLSGYSGGEADLTTSNWLLPTGVELSLRINLNGSSSVRVRYDSSGDVEQTAELALPVGTPLFNLPAGFDVNSTDGLIVNNTYSPVPEPKHAFAVAGTALALFGFWRRLHRR